MSLEFFADMKDVKEKISELLKVKRTKEAKEKVQQFAKFLKDNYYEEKASVDDLIIFSYMYLKNLNPNTPCLEELKNEHKKNRNYSKNRSLINSLCFSYDTKCLNLMPLYSFIIEFEFSLVKPYISKDDENFTIIENSIRREKVLGCPYIPGSTWKGCFRSALWQEGKKENDEQINRMFGNERQEKKQDKFRQGRLHFFPTFFSKSSFEVINPHDRKTRAGTKPIFIECIPAGEKGKFSLLYVPFDLIGKEQDEMKKQMLEDLRLIIEGLEAMFTKYGFGAKTSSGYGIAKINEGLIKVNAQQDKEQIKKSLPKSFKFHETKGLKEKVANLMNENDESSLMEQHFDSFESLKKASIKLLR
ncbi:RAMP superfamily CRISPR-associated protein [Kosmotoga sp. DU53]|uniref:RAMP superfamily CRISPR-associated protein n=1 Tax=Kosmotoga sp. DU53 TaxID=1310160 RepID=UPI0007C49535|nr:RAMP superfamily CRISPR-associated protein [Kosmotoga sp. DU53]